MKGSRAIAPNLLARTAGLSPDSYQADWKEPPGSCYFCPASKERPPA